jgi:hypothetical protein
MVQAHSPQSLGVADRAPWELLSSWLADGNEERFRVSVLRPAHVVSRSILGDRREAWDVTVAALDRVLASLAPLLAPLRGPLVPRDLSEDVGRQLAAAEVDGEPLLCSLLRTRMVPTARRLARRLQVRHQVRAGQRVAFEPEEPSVAGHMVGERQADPEQLAEQHELVDCVRAAVESLKGNVRRAQKLHMDGYSQRQIAAELQLTRSAVRARLETATQMLTAKLHAAYA